MEALEKSKSRDTMIIKFREQRIVDLEKKLIKAKENINDTSMGSMRDVSMNDSQMGPDGENEEILSL